MVEFFSRLLQRHRGITGSPVYRLAVDVATGQISWDQALRHARSSRMASELADGDLIELDRQARFEAETNIDFGLLLSRLTVAAARAKGFEKVYVDISLSLVTMLERAGLEDERDYYLNEALQSAQRVSYQTGYRRVLNLMARYASLEHNDIEARRYLAEQLAIGREDADTRDDVDTAILLAEMALADGDRTTAHDLFQRSARSGRRLGYYSAVVSAVLNQVALVQESGDLEAAERLLRQAGEAADHTNDDRVKGKIALLTGELKLEAGDDTAASDYLGIALRQARKDDNLASEARSLSALAGVERRLERQTIAIDHYRELIALEQRLGNRLEAGRALSELGAIYVDVNQFDEALRSLSSAREIANQSSDAQLIITVHQLIGAILVARGNERGALEAYDVAIAESSKIGAVDQELAGLLGASEAMLRFNGPDAARPVVERAHRLASRVDDSSVRAQILGLRGQIALVEDRLVEAEHAFSEATSIAVSAGEYSIALHYLPLLSRLALEDDDSERASGHLDEAIAMAQRQDDRRALCQLHGQAGTLYHRLGQMERAVDHYERAYELALELDEPRYGARALQGMATGLDVMGDVERALETYRQALDASASIGDTAAVSRSHFNIGSLLVSMHRDDEARSHLNRARDAAESIENWAIVDRATDLLGEIAPPGSYSLDIEDDRPLDESPAPPRDRFL